MQSANIKTSNEEMIEFSKLMKKIQKNSYNNQLCLCINCWEILDKNYIS